MLYLLDANVLIDAHNLHYPLDRVPEFWEWLFAHARKEKVKIPKTVYEEVLQGNNDDLTEWLTQNKETFLLKEEPDTDRVSRVLKEGYDLNAPSEIDIEAIGNDYFLIALALTTSGQRCVVTNEASKPGKQGANRHIPDVCKILKVACINTPKFIKALDFKTSQYR